VERTGQPALTDGHGPRAGGSTSRASPTWSCACRDAVRPMPGDEITGFVTRGRGLSVHRSDCANAVSLVEGRGDRLIRRTSHSCA
jgi:(p)ppGpp synthase/HD superfamily hydrolase